MTPEPLVSIIIPTKNNREYIEQCLKSVQHQTYPHIEVLIIDSHSTDGTQEIAHKYGAHVLAYNPTVAQGHFESTAKRNMGVTRATGVYVYYVDADMELEPTVIKDAVRMMHQGYDAIIVAEDSFGNGIWAQAKNLERRCYWGDDTIEAPRIVKRSVWQHIGGLDESVGGGGDDWDLYQKLLEQGYKTGRIQSIVRHNEGSLSLVRLAKKRFMYGRDAMQYIKKRPLAACVSYFPIRKAYLKHWKLFLIHPKQTLALIIMRLVEYTAGISGALYSALH